jgi:adenylate cyclase
MGIEIERRFLVRDPGAAIACSMAAPVHILQGYFGCIDRLRVRVRIATDERDASTAYLSFKGARRGLCRLEFEYPLPLERARRALGMLPSTHIVRKNRYQIAQGEDAIWSLDRFEGPNAGLVIAEIELAHPKQKVEIPSWVGEEVTFVPCYGNSRLAYAPLPQYLFDAA